ncbi:hypothetical protein H0H92_006601 [Tricholoma furcatifolium]|nr:hypothetical protein H0H92_006601 [Tricholoma furcatifolium]
MEAQCFDPALKSRDNSPVPSTVAGIQDTGSDRSITGFDLFDNGTLDISLVTVDSNAPLYGPYTIDLPTRPPSSSSNPSSTCSSIVLSPENDPLEPPLPLLESEIPFEEEAHSSSCDEYGAVPSEEYTTCKIVRPLPGSPRSPLLNLFSRPCSPISIFSRPGSPINFSNLNCMRSTDNFEDDVSLFQAQRSAAQRGELEIMISTTKEVCREEAWRGPLQDYLYGDDVNNGQIRVLTGAALQAA